MTRKKKFILIGVILAVVVLAVGIGGVAAAQSAGTGQTTGKTLWARVAAILGVDQAKLESAVTQAQREMQSEQLNEYLQGLVDQGKITKDQADQYKKWWESRPNTTIPGPSGRFGMHGFRGGMMGGGWGGVPATPKTSATPS